MRRYIIIATTQNGNIYPYWRSYLNPETAFDTIILLMERGLYECRIRTVWDESFQISLQN